MSGASTLRVATKKHSYTVTVGDDLLGNADEYLAEELSGKNIALITNPEVGRLYGFTVAKALKKICRINVFTMPDGERYKNLTIAHRLFAELHRAKIDRGGVVVALGGGVVGDMAGFVASTYLRGIPWVAIPTTLLSQVDSSIGGKVGVNLRAGKNIVGAFHQPNAVLSDVSSLLTLPQREMNAGMAEVIKYALIGDVKLLGYLKSHLGHELDNQFLVEASVKDKARVVAADERESGYRRVLNLGHTLAHALESHTRYRTFLHGEAVAAGILYSSFVAKRMKRLQMEQIEEIAWLFKQQGLMVKLPLITFQRLYRYFKGDKKVESGVLNFVIPVGIGRTEVRADIPEIVFKEAYQEFRDWYD